MTQLMIQLSDVEFLFNSSKNLRGRAKAEAGSKTGQFTTKKFLLVLVSYTSLSSKLNSTSFAIHAHTQIKAALV